MFLDILLTDNKDSFDNKDFFIETIIPEFASLVIYIDKNHSLLSQLKRKDVYEKCMGIYNGDFKGNKTLEKLIELGIYDMDSKKWADYIHKNFEHILDFVDEIKILNFKNDLLQIIEQNPIILSKKILIQKSFQAKDIKELEDILKKCNSYVDNIYVHVVGDENYVPIKDAISSLRKVVTAAENIKKLNLSPLETIMVTYDLVRKRVYKLEDAEEDYSESRDLTKVLKGDKIVCAGFSKIFNSVLNYLGIKSDNVRLLGKHSSHLRNVVKVNDPKYGVRGVYFFDTTWDSKKEGNNYLLSYRYFAKTADELKIKDTIKGIQLDSMYSLYSLDEYENFKLALENSNLDELIRFIKGSYLSRFVNDRDLLDMIHIINHTIDDEEKEKILKRYLKVVKYLNSPIPAETMIKLTNNVRKIEYYMNPDVFDYSIETLYAITRNSEWSFKRTQETNIDRFLRAMLNEPIKEKSLKGNFIAYIDNHDLESEVNGTKLAKVLRNVYEKKRR